MCIKHLNIKLETLELLEEKLGSKLFHFGLSCIFFLFISLAKGNIFWMIILLHLFVCSFSQSETCPCFLMLFFHRNFQFKIMEFIHLLIYDLCILHFSYLNF